jgi:hypothetical protein
MEDDELIKKKLIKIEKKKNDLSNYGHVSTSNLEQTSFALNHSPKKNKCHLKRV